MNILNRHGGHQTGNHFVFLIFMVKNNKIYKISIQISCKRHSYTMLSLLSNAYSFGKLLSMCIDQEELDLNHNFMMICIWPRVIFSSSPSICFIIYKMWKIIIAPPLSECLKIKHINKYTAQGRQLLVLIWLLQW